MGLKIHNYLFKRNGTIIEFKDTEEAETGFLKDIVFNIDGKTFHGEHKSTPIKNYDLDKFHTYNQSIKCDKTNDVKQVNSFCICTSDPPNNTGSLSDKMEAEIYYRKVEPNYTFELPVFYPKKNGW